MDSTVEHHSSYLTLEYFHAHWLSKVIEGFDYESKSSMHRVLIKVR